MFEYIFISILIRLLLYEKCYILGCVKNQTYSEKYGGGIG